MVKVDKKMNHMKRFWEPLFKDELEPRRLAMKQFIRFNLHESEVKKMRMGVSNSYHTVITKMNKLQSNFGGMCDDYEKVRDEVIVKKDSIVSMFDSMIYDANQPDENGKLGRTTCTQRQVNDAKEFVPWSFNNFIRRNLKCFIDAHPTHESRINEANEILVEARHNLVKKSHQHSVDCHLRLLQNRVRFWEIVTTKQTTKTKDACKDGFKKIRDERKFLLKANRPEKNQVWETPKTKNFNDERVVKNEARLENIEDFFNSWNKCDDKLYDKSLNSSKRKGLAKKASKSAMAVYYWYWRMGDQAMEHHH